MFGKLFSRRTVESERARADEAFERAEYGAAKLAYDRALALVPQGADDVRTALSARVDACRDALARMRMKEAEQLLAQGVIELAQGELSSALEIVADKDLARQIEERLEGLAREEVRVQTEQLAEQSDADRFETIAGSWEPDQFDEYERLGPNMRGALLALNDGNGAQARELLEELAKSAPPGTARYLWFEVGRARSLVEDKDGARAAFEQFLASLVEGEGSDARLTAHVELAAMLRERGDIEAAIAQHQAAIEALPDDPRAYLAMAMFFRREGLFAEAIEVLQAGIDALEGQTTPFRITLELGLAHADQGDTTKAIELLEDVVDYFAKRQQLDLPPECAVKLAQLHEQTGNAARALDLYSLLANGSDLPRLFGYHREAARLLLQLGHKNEARRMLQRALDLPPKLAPQQPEVRAEVEKQLAELR